MTDSRPRYVIRLRPGKDRIQGGPGLYVKVGGGMTDELQEAQVVGWLSPKKGRYSNYGNNFEFVPVEIVIKEPANG